jgi:membrane fusion protein, multidrug efflux system
MADAQVLRRADDAQQPNSERIIPAEMRARRIVAVPQAGEDNPASLRSTPAETPAPAIEDEPPPPETPVRTADSSTAAVDTTDHRRRRLRWSLFAALPLVLAAGGYFYVSGGAVMSSDNAYVQADKVAVSTDVSGIVKAVDVRDNQPVAAGDLLFELEDQPFRLALTRAEAQLALVRDQIEATKASYRDMQAQIAMATADVDFYTREFDRQQALTKRGVASEQAFDQARHNLQVAQQKVVSLKQQLAGIAANLNQNPDIRIEDHPRYIDALAQRDEAARQLAHTKVRAPFAGVVTNVPSLQPGQYLAASTAAFSVVATDHVWVASNPKETDLTHVQPGQPVTVTVDTYPGVEWHGVVDSISPASGATFSLLPAQNTSGNWVKVVQRIPIRVRIDTPPDKPRLRVGMSVTIAVDTGHPRGWPAFVHNMFGGTNNG